MRREPEAALPAVSRPGLGASYRSWLPHCWRLHFSQKHGRREGNDVRDRRRLAHDPFRGQWLLARRTRTACCSLDAGNLVFITHLRQAHVSLRTSARDSSFTSSGSRAAKFLEARGSEVACREAFRWGEAPACGAMAAGSRSWTSSHGVRRRAPESRATSAEIAGRGPSVGAGSAADPFGSRAIANIPNSRRLPIKGRTWLSARSMSAA